MCALPPSASGTPLRTRRTAAVTETLRRRVQAGLHLGTLAPGDRLPSLRDIGAELHAGLRVVQAAYRDLAAEGLVRFRPRSGIFVGEDPLDVTEPLPEVASWLADMLLRGLDRGYPPSHLWRQARACLRTVPIRAACVECNDDQIYSLCCQLRYDYGFDALGVDLDSYAGQGGRAALAKTDLVVTTRFHIPEAERIARRLRRPLLVATLDPVFVNTVRRMLEQGRVWWICTDPRLAAKLPRIFPGYSFNSVVLGHDSLEAIPSDAMVYATRRASEALPHGWREGRTVTITRAFSSQTARALVSFAIWKNLKATRATRLRPRLVSRRSIGISSRRQS
jgi:DNA-binding transcriptional regulator YhcF (GntR family)